MVTEMRRSNSPGMSGPFKGHLAPKSSAFKPTVNKLSTQFLIQDHMSNHVNKILNAKSAIDAKPPKSYEKSVIKRDQVRRNMIEKQMREGQYKAVRNNSNSEYEISHRLHSSSYDDMHSSTSSVSLSKYYRDQLSARPVTANTLGYDRNDPTTNSLDKSNEGLYVRKKTFEGGDYLERHKEKFKNQEQAPFTPRTKINNKGKSKLLESRHYAPPLKLNKPTKRIVSSTASSYRDKSSDSGSSDEDKPHSHHNDSIFPSDINESKNEKGSPSPKMESADERLHRDVEKLNLSSLPSRSSPRSRSPVQLKSSTYTTNTNVYTRFRRSSAERRALERQLEEEERETKYLQFVNEVANEILTRGVYSDRVIIQTMDRHIDRHRGELDEARMHQMLIKLQQDLGIHVNYDYKGYQRESSNDRLGSTSGGGYKNKITPSRSTYTKSIPKPVKRSSKASSVRSSSDIDVAKPARKTSSILVSDSDAASDKGGKKVPSQRKRDLLNKTVPKSASMQSISSVQSKESIEVDNITSKIDDKRSNISENESVPKSASMQSISSVHSKSNQKGMLKDNDKVGGDSSSHKKDESSKRYDDDALSDASSRQSNHDQSGKDEEIVDDTESEASEDDDF